MIIIIIICRRPPADAAPLGLCAEGVPVFTDGIGTPDTNPKHLVNWRLQSTLVDLTFCLNWLSGALAGVGDSDLIGQVCVRGRDGEATLFRAFSARVQAQSAAGHKAR